MSKESALQDVVTDFKTKGTELINKLEQAHEATHKDFIKKAGGIKRSFIEMTDSAQVGLSRNVDMVKKRRLGDLGTEMEKERERLDEAMRRMEQDFARDSS